MKNNAKVKGVKWKGRRLRRLRDLVQVVDGCLLEELNGGATWLAKKSLQKEGWEGDREGSRNKTIVEIKSLALTTYRGFQWPRSHPLAASNIGCLTPGVLGLARPPFYGSWKSGCLKVWCANGSFHTITGKVYHLENCTSSTVALHLRLVTP